MSDEVTTSNAPANGVGRGPDGKFLPNNRYAQMGLVNGGSHFHRQILDIKKEMYRAATPERMRGLTERLISQLETTDDMRGLIVGLEVLLDRLVGKPTQAVQVQSDGPQVNVLNLNLSPADLDQLRAARQIIARNMLPADAPQFALNAPQTHEGDKGDLSPIEAKSSADLK